jgi:RNA polymerase sigma factor (sigma-70 family)
MAAPFLSKIEEAILASRIKEGDHTALQELVEANLALVGWVAAKYRFETYEDRVQRGVEALMRVSHRFDASRCRYSTFAVAVLQNTFNVFLQTAKYNNRTAAFAVSLDELMEVENHWDQPTTDPDYEEKILQEETRTILLEEIDKLPEDEKNCMLFFYGFENVELPNVSRAWHERLRNKAIAKIWRSMKRQGYDIRDFF